jgi:hypothetical protein
MLDLNPNDPRNETLDKKNKLDLRYYSDEGDPLAAMRRQYPGGIIGDSMDGDPFDNDPDWQQHLREDRMNGN